MKVGSNESAGRSGSSSRPGGVPTYEIAIREPTEHQIVKGDRAMTGRGRPGTARRSSPASAPSTRPARTLGSGSRRRRRALRRGSPAPARRSGRRRRQSGGRRRRLLRPGQPGHGPAPTEAPRPAAHRPRRAGLGRSPSVSLRDSGCVNGDWKNHVASATERQWYLVRAETGRGVMSNGTVRSRGAEHARRWAGDGEPRRASGPREYRDSAREKSPQATGVSNLW
jgi:hypothetical protein